MMQLRKYSDTFWPSLRLKNWKRMLLVIIDQYITQLYLTSVDLTSCFCLVCLRKRYFVFKTYLLLQIESIGYT